MKLNRIKFIGTMSIIYGVIEYGQVFLKSIENIFQINNFGNNGIGILGMFYFILYVISGYGLIKSKKWGWYIAVFNSMFLSIRYLEFPVTALIFSKILGIYDVNTYMSVIMKSSIGIIIGVLLILILISQNTRNEFHIEKRLPVIIGINVVLSVAILLFRDLADILDLLKTIN